MTDSEGEASFWPAAAPDNGRTFGHQSWGNQLPMLDGELGFHPKHDEFGRKCHADTSSSTQLMG